MATATHQEQLIEQILSLPNPDQDRVLDLLGAARQDGKQKVGDAIVDAILGLPTSDQDQIIEVVEMRIEAVEDEAWDVVTARHQDAHYGSLEWVRDERAAGRVQPMDDSTL